MKLYYNIMFVYLALIFNICIAHTSRTEVFKSKNKQIKLFEHSYNSAPDEYNWCNINGMSYCVKSKNQHIPQYCGSCWAHGSLSALEDRLKYIRHITNNNIMTDITLSVQHVLNCINHNKNNIIGSCYGSYIESTYEWLVENKIELSYETSLPYLACSSDSVEGFCKYIDTTCKQINIARTCGGFSNEAGNCTALTLYPNLRLKSYGYVKGINNMKNEIYKNGPIACGIDAIPLLNYTTGIIYDKGKSIDHIIEVVGWGKDYWIIRNSWGEYWGEFSFARIGFGALQMESDVCVFGIIDSYTAPEYNNQIHCYENGYNCKDDEQFKKNNVY
jgi:cathepsin X